MILEVDDRGRIERFAVTGSVLEKAVDGRKLIGGTRLVGFGWEEVWFDKAFWNATFVPDEDGNKTCQIVRKAS